MSPLTLFLLLATVAAAPLASAAGGASPNGSVNDILPKYGLPKGLIPDAVASYTFDNTTGDFEIHLAGTCYVWFADHLVYYEKTIRGCLSSGKITGLSGIQAKKLFLWVSVSGIVAHPKDGTLEFQVGFVSEELSASLFDKVPVCGSSAGAHLRGVAGVIRELGLLPVAEGRLARTLRMPSTKSVVASANYYSFSAERVLSGPQAVTQYTFIVIRPELEAENFQISDAVKDGNEKGLLR